MCDATLVAGVIFRKDCRDSRNPFPHCDLRISKIVDVASARGKVVHAPVRPEWARGYRELFTSRSSDRLIIVIPVFSLSVSRPMRFAEVVPTITTLSKDKGLTFPQRAANMAHLLDTATTADVLDHLARAHVIPECFGHDSTEEKLYAKYLDTLLGKALSLLGLGAEVITERADSADVVATSQSYRVVGDAKAFRLSRTAKNQKDFKVVALNSWRHGAEYATLCGPLYQYPSSNSQIYEQAIQYNVTLISYTHLAFLIDSGFDNPESLKELWEVGRGLTSGKGAIAYWRAVNSVVCRLSGKTGAEWDQFERQMTTLLPELAEDQIRFWEKEKLRIRNLPHDVAVRELIKALKIDSKITTIRQSGRG